MVNPVASGDLLTERYFDLNVQYFFLFCDYLKEWLTFSGNKHVCFHP